MTLDNELPKSAGAQCATGEEWKNSPEGMKRLSQSEKNAQLWMCLVVKVKTHAVQNNTAQELGMLGP